MQVTRTLFVCALASVAAFAQSTNMAMVRVVHASPDAPNVNIWVDGARVLENIPYKGYTGYLPVPAGARRIEVQVAPDGPVVLAETFTVMGGGNYTFLAMGRVSGGSNPLQLFGFGDERDLVSGTAKVRVIHAAPSAPAVDVYATSPYVALGNLTPTLMNVPFGAASGFLAVPQGLYQARVTPTGSRTVVIDSGPLPLSGGTISTILALDPETPNGRFQLLVIPTF
jgi:hypothetical protein